MKCPTLAHGGLLISFREFQQLHQRQKFLSVTSSEVSMRYTDGRHNHSWHRGQRKSSFWLSPQVSWFLIIFFYSVWTGGVLLKFISPKTPLWSWKGKGLTKLMFSIKSKGACIVYTQLSSSFWWSLGGGMFLLHALFWNNRITGIWHSKGFQ